MMMNAKAYGSWMKTGMDMWLLGAEAASVMALRTARIAAEAAPGRQRPS
ncbi:hypothetical protein [Sphingomonas sp. BAUL-RG-20F-R05-02]|nr:hypothetical protein [Sphingomonas sp. BAUL-RG-20F-R05-02]